MIPGWIINIGTIGLSGLVSLLVARHTVNKRVEEDRQRDVEKWYIEAGVQSELAKRDWSNEILSEGSTEGPSEQVLRSRASTLEEHAAKGNFLQLDEDVISALQQISANYRYAALLLERDNQTNGSELKEIEDEMWIEVDTVRQNIPDRVEYGTDE
ncbi:hypothetical protein [Halobacterium salinarum]|uniref:hypothetical protein n=1 Tax=Halobacterium salinarum TaxID=2242 RepID=UPI001F46AAFA|nr:hypothetical protein [Halobacterium salinarum]MCF2165815.1 hypothetical protein [Halobacterium salinarum]MCF2167416.1 hypothetical protein [Halobacterium salinarum]